MDRGLRTPFNNDLFHCLSLLVSTGGSFLLYSNNCVCVAISRLAFMTARDSLQLPGGPFAFPKPGVEEGALTPPPSFFFVPTPVWKSVLRMKKNDCVLVKQCLRLICIYGRRENDDDNRECLLSRRLGRQMHVLKKRLRDANL